MKKLQQPSAGQQHNEVSISKQRRVVPLAINVEVHVVSSAKTDMSTCRPMIIHVSVTNAKTLR